MISKISFTGLKGLSTPENKKNLQLLNKIYGKTFIDSAQTAFAKIDKISGDKDVFLHTNKSEGFANDFMEFTVTDSNQKSIASSRYKMGPKPEKYANTKGLLETLVALQTAFERNFYADAETSDVDELISRYS